MDERTTALPGRTLRPAAEPLFPAGCQRPVRLAKNAAVRGLMKNLLRRRFGKTSPWHLPELSKLDQTRQTRRKLSTPLQVNSC